MGILESLNRLDQRVFLELAGQGGPLADGIFTAVPAPGLLLHFGCFFGFYDALTTLPQHGFGCWSPWWLPLLPRTGLQPCLKIP